MKRTYALKRLLEHGPMISSEITECTRWTGRQVQKTLQVLLKQRVIRQVTRTEGDRRGYAYEVAQ